MIAQNRELKNLFSDNIKFIYMYIFLIKSPPFSTEDFIVFSGFSSLLFFFFTDFVPASFQKRLNRFTSIFHIWQVLIWTLLIFLLMTSLPFVRYLGFIVFYRGVLSGEHLFTIQDVMLNFRAGRQKPRGLKLILSRKRRRFPELLH